MSPNALQLIPTRFSASLRSGWLVFVALLGLSAVRRWLLSQASAQRPGSRPSRSGAPPSGGTRSFQGGGGGGGGGASSASRGRVPSSTGRPASPPSRGRPPSGGAAHRGAPEAPFAGPASEAELGPWHFNGHRRWLWMHDGLKANGWIELGASGTLQTSFGGGGTGSWERRSTGELLVSFGRCLHVLELLQQPEEAVPMFCMRERTMKDGSQSRGGAGRTKGRIDDLGAISRWSGHRWVELQLCLRPVTALEMIYGLDREPAIRQDAGKGRMGAILSEPVTAMVVERCTCAHWASAVVTMQGWRRSHEDAHILSECSEGSSGVFAVLDGHGGQTAAEEGAVLLKARLEQLVKRGVLNADDAARQMEAGETVTGCIAGDWLFIACDGVFDVMENDEALR
ncbi:unnamed protein product [Polarella glacialis]|uniref:Uncharacterized protein n=1 Tax=Polarella glacialis TaxID=89957 RepID=A0A813FAR9_POLGL|nr:unnamed protein product [Polarella glacialis]